MGVITLEVVEKDGVGEIPVVATQVTMGMGGPQVLRCGMLVVVVADLVRELELLLADATIFNFPMLILLLGGKDGQIVDVEMSMSLFATVENGRGRVRRSLTTSSCILSNNRRLTISQGPKYIFTNPKVKINLKTYCDPTISGSTFPN
jgi:hypothetical protein